MEEVKDALEFGATVVPARFDYLGPVRFVWATIRRRRGKQYRDIANGLGRITSAYPNAKISVIAHSFGTFIIADLIRRDRLDRLEFVVFCGSIMPLDFPWTEFKERFRRVFNDCGEKDIWPIVAKSVAFRCGVSGRFGFGDAALVVNRFHDVDHVGFLNRSFARRYWRPIFRADEKIPDGNICRSPPSFLQGVLLRLKGILVFACALLLALYWLA